MSQLLPYQPRIENRPNLVPSLRAGHIPRPRLGEALLHAECRLRLLWAPAGSGKSFLLRECAQHCPPEARLHWFDLKDRELGEAGFLQLLADALGLARADLAAVQVHLEQQQTPIWLMFDDFPHFYDAHLDSCLNRLLQSSSRQVFWWIASRRRPTCQLARLLLEGELFELGTAELALNFTELAEVLKRQRQTALLPEIDNLLAQTGGWYAGIRLRLHSVEHGQLLAEEAGNALVKNYLERELLDELPEHWRQALCALACLSSFDAPLCEHLLGMGEGTQLFRQLYECGAFIEALDSNDRQFRVQPVVAAVLATRVAEGPKKALYRRACQWFSGREEVRQAIEYALLADLPEVVASLLQHITQDRLLHGRGMARVLHWRNELPESLLASTPRLLILNAWALALSGRLDDAEECAEQLQRFLPQATARRQREMLAQCQALAAKTAYHRGQAPVPGGDLDAALDHLAEGAWAQRLMLETMNIEMALVEGRMEAFQELNRNAVKLAREHGSLVMEAMLVLQHVQLLKIRGELVRAESLLKRLHTELSNAWDGEPNPLRGRAQLCRGSVLLQLGRYPEAAVCYQAGLQECLDCEDPAAVWGYLGLAELEAAEHDLTQAFARLAEAERLMQYRRITEPVYQDLLVVAYGKLWLREGRYERAADALEKCLQQYRGPDGRKPPYGSAELIQRMELLLALAQTACGRDVTAQIEAMLQQALAEGRRVLACELWLGLAEAQYARSQQGLAQRALLDGLALARQIGLADVERCCSQRNPGLMRWGREALSEAGSSAAALLLSQRELTVLEMIARGQSNQEIAENLFISLHTVKSHAQRINIKLGVSRRTQAIVRAKELGLVK
ncbi:helix-turn-helix transcriptional regulator [Pseudomonas sp. UL073]|uniref:Helix-turn-helix transcriptional regulator n=1 Tax=Zestomonas insulae TaxID=2809017 RepID=A0ABS2IFI3_9GAMM|nr:LuxR C-terminal-related transcriptional regulator [Pseudomonas insulae]MBM7061849.1 helix-turn-helix transcriptional regulator [Pseudomonas insulae]